MLTLPYGGDPNDPNDKAKRAAVFGVKTKPIPKFSKTASIKNMAASILFPGIVNQGAAIYDSLVDFTNERMKTGVMTSKEKDLRERIASSAAFDYPRNPKELRESIESISKGKTHKQVADLTKDGDAPNGMGLWKEMMRKYMGLDTKALVESSHKPSKSKNPNAKYYDFSDKSHLIKYLQKEGFENTVAKIMIHERGKKRPDLYGESTAENNPLSQYTFDDDLNLINPPTGRLWNYRVGAGKDDNGPYISYYDKWDVDAPILKGTKVDIDKVSSPYEIYGRVYKKDLEKKALGGTIGSAVGSLGDLAIPGLGSVMSPILSILGNTVESKISQPKMFNRQMSQVTPTTSVYSHGGYISGREDLAQYTGSSHANGGIEVNKSGIPSSNSVAEVEGDESILRIKGKNFVFSKKLKI